jgi:hypothetical protein
MALSRLGQTVDIAAAAAAVSATYAAEMATI